MSFCNDKFKGINLICVLHSLSSYLHVFQFESLVLILFSFTFGVLCMITVIKQEGVICFTFKAVASPAKLFPKLKHITFKFKRVCRILGWTLFLLELIQLLVFCCPQKISVF